MRKFAAALGMTLCLAVPARAEDAKPWTVPGDAAIRAILKERIDTEHKGVGIVVGVIDRTGRRIVSYGRFGQNDPRPVDGGTVFEIGSMTKVFTGLLLADMALKGEVALEDPAAKFLPPTVKVPERGGKQIRLLDLATQSSGLPRMPSNFNPKDQGNPYADYSVDMLYQFLSGYALPRDIGSQYEYSNLGFALLGHTLSLRAGKGYEALVTERIIAPLGLKSTAITLSADMKKRLAAGHDGALRPVPNWDLPTFAGAGALRSTANDMLAFLGAELGSPPSPLKDAMSHQLSAVRRPTGKNMEVALAWGVVNDPGVGTMIWHNGGTGGYRTFFGFRPDTGEGVVALANASTETGVDDIGFHLLLGKPLLKFPVHTEVALDAKATEPYLGRYQLAPNVIVDITREGNQLFSQLTGQPKVEMYPESQNGFFLKLVEAQFTFDVGPDQKVTGLTLHQHGRHLAAPRIAP